MIGLTIMLNVLYLIVFVSQDKWSRIIIDTGFNFNRCIKSINSEKLLFN